MDDCYKELDISRDMFIESIVIDYNSMMKEHVSERNFTSKLDLHPRVLEAFSSRCDAFVAEEDPMVSLEHLSHITQFFFENRLQFCKKDIDTDFFLRAFNESGLLMKLSDMLVSCQHKALYHFIAMISYISSNIATELVEQSFFDIICDNLPEDLSSAKHCLDSLHNLLMSVGDFSPVFDRFVTLVNFARIVGNDRRAAMLCYIIVTRTDVIDHYPMMVDFFGAIVSGATMDVIAACCSFMLKRDANMGKYFIENGIIETMLALDNVEFPDDGYSYVLKDILAIGDAFTPAAEVCKSLADVISRLLRGPRCAVALNFLVDTCTWPLNAFGAVCRGREVSLCREILLPKLQSGAKHEKVISLHLLHRLASFPRTVEWMRSNPEEMECLLREFEDLDDDSVNIAVEELVGFL